MAVRLTKNEQKEVDKAIGIIITAIIAIIACSLNILIDLIRFIIKVFKNNNR